MCGINGIISTELLGGESHIRKMNALLRHRGPNNEGSYSNNGVFLGHTRLSIIDLSNQGNQPFVSFDGRYVLVFNGEIYNYKELREQIDYPFQTSTDTEVLLASYIVYGPHCLTKLNGMFAFCIYDKYKQTAFIARDRLGIKPLYYHVNKSTFIFSSELRPILKSDIDSFKVSTRSVKTYLKYQKVYGPNTIVDGIKSLNPGHFITIDCKNILFEIEKYWRPGLSNDSDESTSKLKTRALLEDSVRRRMISDVSVGAFLSGGIDSSIIVALMSQISDRRINTFNITFGDDVYSESIYAKQVADRYKTNHRELILTPQFFLENITKALSSMDNPSGDGINTWMVSSLTKSEGITVALSGLGGDELFGGYDVFHLFKRFRVFEDYLRFAWFLKEKLSINLGSSIKSQKLSQLMSMNGVNHIEFNLLFRQSLLNSQIDKLLHIPNLTDQQYYIEEIEAFNKVKGYNISKISLSEMSLYMSNTLLNDTDQMSMAHQLEVRVPFLDHIFVEHVLSLPDELKFSGRPKEFLVDIFTDLLPSDVYNRKKMGFVLPWESWLRSEMKDFANSYLMDFAKREFVNELELDLLWQGFLKNAKDVNYSRIWAIIALEYWLQENSL